MKLAVAGKGGVGKTTISGTLCRLLARDGYRVLAIDADPAMNLAYSLGIPRDTAAKVTPISENEKLVEERTGFKPGSGSGIFNLTPRVSDIAEKYSIPGPDGVRLLVMGTVMSGGSGCMCPSNSLIRALLRNLLVERGDVVVMDMEAGLEHLGRGTVRRVDALLSVTEPGRQSIETTQRISKLAGDLGIKEVLAVGNKIRGEEEVSFLKAALTEAGLPLLALIPFDPEFTKADMARVAPLDFVPSSPAVQAINELVRKLRAKYP